MHSLDELLEAGNASAFASLVQPVLLVDDSDTMRSIVRSLLAKLGVREVQEANGARSAFDTLKQRRFGIVVCDIEMRDVSGLQLVQAVRSDPELRSTPILLITGSMKPDYIGQGRHLGADGFLLKPFTVQALRRKMVEVVSLAQSEATNAFRLAHAYRAGGSRFN